MDHLRHEKKNRERELEAENNQLKRDIVKLRTEMGEISSNLQTIVSTKPDMELEIAAYRKLLENEESRSA